MPRFSMTGKEEVTNLALAHLGHSRRINNINEQSAEALASRAIFDYAHKKLLAFNDWGFASTRVIGAKKYDGFFNWRYAFSYPSEALVLRDVYDVTRKDCEHDFIVQRDAKDNTRVVCVNTDPIQLRYTAHADLAQAPFHYIDALSWGLAYHMSSKISSTVPNLYDTMIAQMMDAATLDANEHLDKGYIHIADHIAARNHWLDSYDSTGQS